jgi:hypothetical protein
MSKALTNRKQESSITKKAKTRRERAQETEAVGRFDILVEKSQKFCEAVGLHKDLILEIAKTDSDWAFILKIDALLETASKEIIRHVAQMDAEARLYNAVRHSSPACPRSCVVEAMSWKAPLRW